MPPFSPIFKKLNHSKKNPPEEVEKCLKLLHLLEGVEETNGIKSGLYQQLVTDRAHGPQYCKYIRRWSQ